jgi:hypothetical protein
MRTVARRRRYQAMMVGLSALGDGLGGLGGSGAGGQALLDGAGAQRGRAHADQRDPLHLGPVEGGDPDRARRLQPQKGLRTATRHLQRSSRTPLLTTSRAPSARTASKNVSL